MANTGFLSDGQPITPALNEAGTDGGFKVVGSHASILAILCYKNKQHFARAVSKTNSMSKLPINEVLAANLAHFMQEKKLTQTAIAAASGIGQTTVSLYLRPEARLPGKSGKLPSAKLSEVESLATAIGVEVWELLRPLTPAQRAAYQQIEAAYKNLSAPQEVVDTPRVKSRSTA